MKRKMWIIALVSLIIVVAIMATVAVLYMGRMNNAKQQQARYEIQIKKSSEPEVSSMPVQSTAIGNEADNNETEATDSSALTAKVSAVKTLEPSPDVVSPLRATSIFTLGARTFCDSSQIRMDIPQATVYMSGDQAGTLSWQVEESINGSISIGIAQSAQVAYHQITYDLDSVLRNYVFITSGSSPGIRIHVTSPSDIATPWYYMNSLAAGNCGI